VQKMQPASDLPAVLTYCMRHGAHNRSLIKESIPALWQRHAAATWELQRGWLFYSVPLGGRLCGCMLHIEGDWLQRL
jgi:hypothetical protein